jgi:hypothetical protein
VPANQGARGNTPLPPLPVGTVGNMSEGAEKGESTNNGYRVGGGLSGTGSSVRGRSEEMGGACGYWVLGTVEELYTDEELRPLCVVRLVGHLPPRTLYSPFSLSCSSLSPPRRRKWHICGCVCARERVGCACVHSSCIRARILCCVAFANASSVRHAREVSVDANELNRIPLPK